MALTVAPTAPSVASLGVCKPAEPSAEPLATEVVVVGSGAGGAVAGTELARKGKRVLFLEAGDAYGVRDFQQPSLPRAARTLFQHHGVGQIARGTVPIMLQSSRVVGGSTVQNSAICFRPPDARLAEWSSIAQAPWLAPDAMRPLVDEIWRRVGVTATHLGNGKRHNDLLRVGLERLGGIRHAWMDRNAPGCLGCGVCHMGCPSGGKASVDRSILPEAINLGARILTRARVDTVIVEGGRATGVEVSCLDERGRPRGTLRVRADLVVLAGGALGTPLVLQNSRVGGEHCGRHLSIHPALVLAAEFSEPVVMWDGVPQGYYAFDPVDERAILETANIGPAELFALFGRAAPDGMAELLRMKHLALAGAMVRDVGGGKVTLTGDLRSTIEYELQAADLAAFRAGTRTLVRAYFAAGAVRVAPGVVPLDFYGDEAAALEAVEQLMEPEQLAQAYASHPHGTCRMGPRHGKGAGVVDGTGQVHGVGGLYVMDGSVFPSTLGVNPQITIMSVALALSRRLL
ncbi:MAG: GMC family oxidoreductase [Deltaproteobacteria bacterium]|nr:GMC family oxidoreductase [Deltaproteobacteria bacterium]